MRVSCPGGLTAEDEFYLWGLLSLTLSQPQPVPNLIATRHYCLRQLGKIDSRRRGGRQYRQLAESLDSLDARSQDIIQRRWLTDDKATLHELADEYGVSAERIRQLEKNAMKKIRRALDAETVAG